MQLSWFLPRSVNKVPMDPIRVWFSLISGEAATPVKLVVEEWRRSGPAFLHPDILAVAAPDFKETVDLAYRQTLFTVGWPDSATFRIGIESIDPLAFPLPYGFEGDSHFGAVAVGLAQAVARAYPDHFRAGANHLLPVLQAVSLERVAVAAALDSEKGDFKPVGCIRTKLDSFCMLEVSRPAVCFISPTQNLTVDGGPLLDVPLQNDPDPYVSVNGHQALPLLRARDPIDVFVQLWRAEAGTFAGCL